MTIKANTPKEFVQAKSALITSLIEDLHGLTNLRPYEVASKMTSVTKAGVTVYKTLGKPFITFKPIEVNGTEITQAYNTIKETV